MQNTTQNAARGGTERQHFDWRSDENTCPGPERLGFSLLLQTLQEATFRWKTEEHFPLFSFSWPLDNKILIFFWSNKYQILSVGELSATCRTMAEKLENTASSHHSHTTSLIITELLEERQVREFWLDQLEKGTETNLSLLPQLLYFNKKQTRD